MNTSRLSISPTTILYINHVLLLGALGLSGCIKDDTPGTPGPAAASPANATLYVEVARYASENYMSHDVNCWISDVVTGSQPSNDCGHRYSEFVNLSPKLGKVYNWTVDFKTMAIQFYNITGDYMDLLLKLKDDDATQTKHPNLFILIGGFSDDSTTISFPPSAETYAGATAFKQSLVCPLASATILDKNVASGIFTKTISKMGDRVNEYIADPLYCNSDRAPFNKEGATRKTLYHELLHQLGLKHLAEYGYCHDKDVLSDICSCVMNPGYAVAYIIDATTGPPPYSCSEDFIDRIERITTAIPKCLCSRHYNEGCQYATLQQLNNEQ